MLSAVHALRPPSLWRIKVYAYPLGSPGLHCETVIGLTIGTGIISEFAAYDCWNRAHGQAYLRAHQWLQVLHRNHQFMLTDVTGQLKRAAYRAFLRRFGPGLQGQNN